MKDRLIEVIQQSGAVCEDCRCPLYTRYDEVDALAERILADGWIRQPCKVGDTVYIIAKSRFTEQYKVLEKIVLEMAYKHEKWWIVVNEYPTKLVFGDRVFPSPEEAEKALKGRENNE